MRRDLEPGPQITAWRNTDNSGIISKRLSISRS